MPVYCDLWSLTFTEHNLKLAHDWRATHRTATLKSAILLLESDSHLQQVVDLNISRTWLEVFEVLANGCPTSPSLKGLAFKSRLPQVLFPHSIVDCNWLFNVKLWNLPTVKTLQAEDCLQMAMQSLVTDVSGCVRSPRLLQPSDAEQTTVMPAVFSYVSTPPKHCPDTQESMLRMRAKRAVGSRWFQRLGLLRCRWKWKIENSLFID